MTVAGVARVGVISGQEQAKQEVRIQRHMGIVLAGISSRRISGRLLPMKQSNLGSGWNARQTQCQAIFRVSRNQFRRASTLKVEAGAVREVNQPPVRSCN